MRRADFCLDFPLDYGVRVRLCAYFLKALLLGAACWLGAASVAAQNAVQNAVCTKPVYLTLDTGHMEVAPLIGDILKRQGVRVTFFVANEASKMGDGSLGDYWAAWWKRMAQEGHSFASHTYDHLVWRSDKGKPVQAFNFKPTAGANAGKELTLDAAGYCAQIEKAQRRIAALTGQKPLPLFRAPGGKTSPALLAAARACGYAHVGWSPAGFLGDELPSERFSNAALLASALRDIRAGDILLAHLGIWSRADPWAPADLEPLIVGLKARGFCFQTLREHPQYKDWIASHSP